MHEDLFAREETRLRIAERYARRISQG